MILCMITKVAVTSIATFINLFWHLKPRDRLILIGHGVKRSGTWIEMITIGTLTGVIRSPGHYLTPSWSARSNRRGQK
jgi:predicted FMN-binding regulatory protein PaiB